MNLQTVSFLKKSVFSGLMILVWIVSSGFGTSFKSFAPKADRFWSASASSSTQKVDHVAWDAILKKYISRDADGLNRFAYKKVSAQDRKALETYISNLTATDARKLARPEQLAYWLNLYNALTIKVVLDHYPVKTIKDIDISGLLSNGPWGKKLVKIAGKDVSLDDIEHRILRPIWKDPRIHYGVNCASIGCPNLQNTAFTAANADKLLEKGASEYVNSKRGVEIDEGDVIVSNIYSWFAYDFGNSEKAVLKHLIKYAKPELAKSLKKINEISDAQYDWALNE